MPSINTRFFTKVRNVAQPDGSALVTYPVDIEFPTAAFVATDMIRLIEVPAGVALVDYAFIFQDIDSNASPAFAFSFGVMNAADTDLSTTYSSALTAGQSSAIVRNANSAAAFDSASTALVRRLGIRVTTAAATYAGSGQRGIVLIRLRG